jgi:uncharacterized protein YjbI with pentapeptide repeats
MESISETDFNVTILIISNFSQTDCEHSKFNRTSLLQADFCEADFCEAEFIKANFRNTLLDNLIVLKIDFSEVH